MQEKDARAMFLSAIYNISYHTRLKQKTFHVGAYSVKRHTKESEVTPVLSPMLWPSPPLWSAN